MTPSKSKCLIVGVSLGEAHINIIRGGIPPLTADFALVREDGQAAGLIQRRLGWGEKTLKALAELQAAMEEETLDHVFESQPIGSTSAAEPEQV
jgi:hypothetical protein